jgi:hypothetical protein
MGLTLIPPYYAGAAMTYLPYASGDLALRYVAKARPDFIVLEEEMKIELPYLAAWFDNGIPDARARLVYDEGGPGRERIKIYRWVVNPP